MLWEYAVIALVGYIVILFILSEEYMSFLKSRELKQGNILMVIILTVCIICLYSYLIVAWFQLVRGNTLILSILFIITILPTIMKIMNIGKPRIVTSKRLTLDRDEIEYHVYSGSEVSAFYNHSTRKIYVHEKLEELLDENEREAILYHEHRHSLQASRRPYSIALDLTYYAVSVWLFAGFIISALASYIISSVIIFSTATLNIVLTVVPALITLYLVLTQFSLIVVYLRWVWEHDADFYATERAGSTVFAKALVKVYVAGHLAREARYVSPIKLDFKLEDIPPLTQRDVFKELLIRTLSLRGFIDFMNIVAKPLEETHPPLYLRLRAIRTVKSR